MGDAISAQGVGEERGAPWQLGNTAWEVELGVGQRDGGHCIVAARVWEAQFARGQVGGAPMQVGAEGVKSRSNVVISRRGGVESQFRRWESQAREQSGWVGTHSRVVSGIFTFTSAAYHLVRIPRLVGACPRVNEARTYPEFCV